ncbi:MAG: NAD(P)H-binding protein [Roseomonas sp.]|nr:NAD(P)H-binding protein [Roseomonas sp.]
MVLGGTGRIGREIVAQGVARGHHITAQSRGEGPHGLPPSVAVVRADPSDPAALAGALAGQDAVIYALGFRGRGEVSFFSATTKALLAAMHTSGVRRLIAITGIGAGDTKGHGGFVYDRLIYPLFTKNLYADKDRQEALIRASRFDWTMLRPAPFKTRPGNEPFQILTAVAPGTRLSSVTPAEVASLALDCAERGLHQHQAAFFGHGVAA